MTGDPRTVLITTDAVGGIWTYTLGLCRSLPSIHFTLATMGPSPSQHQREEVESIPNIEHVECAEPLEWMPDPWIGLQRAGDWLLELAQQRKPDIIHLNSYVHAALPWQRPVMIVAHSCVLSWWNAVKKSHAPDSWKSYAKAVSKGLKAADWVIAPTIAMAEAISHHYGVPRPHVIPNGIDCQDHGIPATRKPMILSAGRFWDEAKNVGTLTRIAPKLPWRLVLAGDTPHDLSQVKNVSTTGICTRSAMVTLFRQATIYAHPARYEPFGLAPLEAAVHGCVLVLADIPSLHEIWEDAAEFICPDDPDAWLSVLHHLTSNRDACHLLAKKAQLRSRRYTLKRMALAYLDAYRSIIGPKLHIPALVS